MSIALVIVHKTLGGHKWSNTHCIQIGGSGLGAPTDADLVTAGAGTTFDASTTGASPVNILQAIVAFERLIHQPDVSFTDILVTDGKRNTGTAPSTQYAAIPFTPLPGIMGGTATAGATLVAGAITLLVHRNVNGFGHKPGRLFIRGSLADTNVEVGGQKMIQWTGTSATSFATFLATAAAKLSSWWFGAANAGTAQYMLPIYVTPKQKAANPSLPPVGTLVNAVGVSGMSLVGPVVHQVPRGRKRK